MKIRKKRWLTGVMIVMSVLILGVIIAAIWYRQMLQPVDPNKQQSVQVTIEKGMTTNQLAKALEQKQLIRSAFAFSVVVRLSGAHAFQAGTYSINPSQSLPEIVRHLTGGQAEMMSVTFYPGATLDTKATSGRTTTVASVLKKAGFSDEQIQQAFRAEYTGAALAGRPAGAGLEGYVYGETYSISSDASAQQVLQRAVTHFSQIVTKYDLERKFASRGLTLYQGITLASIVQKESKGCGAGVTVCEDQRQIASVFYNRLKKDIPLGSDVTYHYAADKAGVARDHTLNSPYNTRLHKGLPPGPIAVPGLSALNAVADPATTDNLYFISGDDDVTYFGKTEADHQANVKAHCAKKCLLP